MNEPSTPDKQPLVEPRCGVVWPRGVRWGEVLSRTPSDVVGANR